MTQLKQCTRSHPHENMDEICELRTEIARLTNQLAQPKQSEPPTLQELKDTLRATGQLTNAQSWDVAEAVLKLLASHASKEL